MTDTPKLDSEQVAALQKFAQDFRTASPHIVAAAQDAQRIFHNMTRADTWTIAETAQPQDVSEPQMWTVGHAEVNYVDHIQTRESLDE